MEKKISDSLYSTRVVYTRLKKQARCKSNTRCAPLNKALRVSLFELL